MRRRIGVEVDYHALISSYPNFTYLQMNEQVKILSGNMEIFFIAILVQLLAK